MARNPYAYHVSAATRRRELSEAIAAITRLDAQAAAGLTALFEACGFDGEDRIAPAELALTSPEAAAALGLTDDEIGALAWMFEADEDWFPAAPAKPYQLATAVEKRLDATYGEVMSAAMTRAWRATAVRRKRTAEKALAAAGCAATAPAP